MDTRSSGLCRLKLVLFEAFWCNHTDRGVPSFTVETIHYSAPEAVLTSAWLAKWLQSKNSVLKVDQNDGAAALSQHAGAAHRGSTSSAIATSATWMELYWATVGVEDHLAGWSRKVVGHPQRGLDAAGAHVVLDCPSRYPDVSSSR